MLDNTDFIPIQTDCHGLTHYLHTGRTSRHLAQSGYSDQSNIAVSNQTNGGLLAIQLATQTVGQRKTEMLNRLIIGSLDYRLQIGSGVVCRIRLVVSSRSVFDDQINELFELNQAGPRVLTIRIANQNSDCPKRCSRRRQEWRGHGLGGGMARGVREFLQLQFPFGLDA